FGRHARRGGRVRVVARGIGAFATGKHQRQHDDDKDCAGDPAPRGGRAHPAVHLHPALHIHPSIEVSGVRHGDLPSQFLHEDNPQEHVWFLIREQTGKESVATRHGAAYSLRSKISWVWVTMAASLPSPRVMRVSST